MKGIITVPAWFEEILYAGKDESIVMWYFIKRYLSENKEKMKCSYNDIEEATGLFAPGISSSIKKLVEMGCLEKLLSGKLSGDGSGPKKGIYRINWNFRGNHVKDKLKRIESHKQDIDLKPMKDVDTGESCRVGMWGESEEKQGWYSVGMDAGKKERKKTMSEIAMDKFNSGKIENMGWMDFKGYWENKYLERYGKHYQDTLDPGWIIRIFRTLGKRVGNKGIIQIIDWLVGIQSVWKSPSIAMLGSAKYFIKIMEGVKAYHGASDGYLDNTEED